MAASFESAHHISTNLPANNACQEINKSLLIRKYTKKLPHHYFYNGNSFFISKFSYKYLIILPSVYSSWYVNVFVLFVHNFGLKKQIIYYIYLNKCISILKDMNNNNQIMTLIINFIIS